MSISTNTSQNHSLHPFRLWSTAIAITLLTPLLLHPSVPQIARTLHEWGPTGNLRNFGYLAHMLAYFVVSLLVVLILRQGPNSRVLWALGTLLIHGVATEVAQLWIPARDFDPFDMSCNLVSVCAAGVLWHLCLRRPALYAESTHYQ